MLLISSSVPKRIYYLPKPYLGNLTLCPLCRKNIQPYHNPIITRRGNLQRIYALGADEGEDLKEVEDIIGIKLEFGENGQPSVLYRVQWKDDSSIQTWEKAINVSEDMIERYEDKWWTACKKGDEEIIKKMLQNGSEVLTNLQDENGRTVAHFAAALNKAELLYLLAKVGANLDAQDSEGYTPLHMATGYLHVPTCMVLLREGASPEVKDKQSRDVMGLIDSLRENMPPQNAALMPARLALEEVASFVAESLYDEVQPKAILDVREVAGGRKEYLIQWPDGQDDSWVLESDLAQDVLLDYQENLEYAEAEEILNMKIRGDVHMFQVRWADNGQITWEPEQNINPSMVEDWWKQHPDIWERIQPTNGQPRDFDFKKSGDGNFEVHTSNNVPNELSASEKTQQDVISV